MLGRHASCARLQGLPKLHDKWLLRRGIHGGLTCIWVRERTSSVRGGAVHSHMLFHLPHPFTTGRKRIEVEAALERLIARHGGGDCLDQASKITEPDEPDGVYFLKGGGPDVWDEFDVPRQWRTPQGKIYGKRCGFTENIGPTARKRWNSEQGRNEQVRERRGSSLAPT